VAGTDFSAGPGREQLGRKMEKKNVGSKRKRGGIASNRGQENVLIRGSVLIHNREVVESTRECRIPQQLISEG